MLFLYFIYYVITPPEPAREQNLKTNRLNVYHVSISRANKSEVFAKSISVYGGGKWTYRI